MFSLRVHSDNLDFLTYLRQESTYDVKEDAFLFSTVEQASRVITRFILFFSKDLHLSQLSQEVPLSKDDMNELLVYLPSEKMEKIYQFINQKILIFLSQSSFFHFEGFIQFRLRSEMDMILNLFWKAYDDFLEYSFEPSNIEFLRTFLEDQPSLEERVQVICNSDGFTIQSDSKIYIEHETEEDTMLSHLAIISPKYVDVYEDGLTISPTFTVILTELFGKRVIFHGFDDGSFTHQKKER